MRALSELVVRLFGRLDQSEPREYRVHTYYRGHSINSYTLKG